MNFEREQLTEDNGNFKLSKDTLVETLPEGVAVETVEQVDTWRQDVTAAAGKVYSDMIRSDYGHDHEGVRPTLTTERVGAFQSTWMATPKGSAVLAVEYSLGDASNQIAKDLTDWLTSPVVDEAEK